MTILGIETSCDETALALIETRDNEGIFECRIISSLIHSQAELHSPYGGVFPMLAKREHEKHLLPLLEKLLGQAEATFSKEKPKIDAIAVTEGPGLEPALWTGITFAEKLSKLWGIPVIPVNHMEGHVVGSLLKSDAPDGEWKSLKELPMPALALLISGGHTELVKVESIERDENLSLETRGLRPAKRPQGRKGEVFVPFQYTILGQTKDDAVGEAFDKVARLLGLPYPGGPHISKLAKEAREQNISSPVKLPRPMIHSKDLNFSFSGLKTAVLYAVKDSEKISSPTGTLSEDFKKGLAREFEESITETIDSKLRKALEETGAQSVIVGGGVSANVFLCEQLEKTATEYGVTLFLPSKHISGDNALMIALAGALNGIGSSNSIEERAIKAQGTKRLGN